MNNVQTFVRGAVAATALAAVMAGAAQAAVVTYAGPPIPIPKDIDGLYLNVVTGATGAGVFGWDFNAYFNNTTFAFFAQGAGQPQHGYVGSGPTINTLSIGTVVGPASTFTSGNVNGGFTNPVFGSPGGDFFVGFRFINESNANSVHFGYAQVRTSAPDGFPAQLVTYSFESTPNVAITVVPEPSTYAMMLAGLAAVAGFAARRRKAD